MMKNILMVLVAFLCATMVNAQSADSDRKAVEKACMDYIMCFYKADTLIAKQSIHPKVQKRGFFFPPDQKAYTDQLEMPYPRFMRVVKTWNADGKQANDQSLRKVEIFDVADKTASAKVTAVWGIDYIHLAKIDDHWWVMNVMWQSPPKN